MKYDTFFVESEAMLALTNNDPDYARERVEELSLAELETFSLQLAHLHAIVKDRRTDLVLNQVFPAQRDEQAIAGLRRMIQDLETP